MLGFERLYKATKWEGLREENLVTAEGEIEWQLKKNFFLEGEKGSVTAERKIQSEGEPR